MRNKLKVCAYAIAKNESKFVERWVESMKEADIMIVGDTGSTDNTVEKLEALGVIVHKINITPWRFDKARNAILDLVPKDIDICICTDLDEIADKGWRSKLEQAWHKDTTRLKYNYNWSFDEYGKPATSFYIEKAHSRNNYHWMHPVHEVLAYTGEGVEKIDYAGGFEVNHYPDLTKSRSNYLPLLELSVEENPDDDRNVHYLGREYMYYEMWDKSIETLQKHLSLERATWKDERCASMRYISRCYQNKNDINSARDWLYKAIIEAPYLREPYVELALLEFNQKNFTATLHMCLEALKITNKSMNYINENFAWDSTIYDLCSISYYNMELLDKALEYSDKAIELEPNSERLKGNNLFFKTEIANKKS